ncbi:MAG: imelysin family protein [Pseudomonadota bacterium]
MNPPRSESAMRAVLWLGSALMLGAWASPGLAQTGGVPVPFYTPGDLMRSVYKFWYVPQAKNFAEQAALLPAAIAKVCEAGSGAAQLEQARSQWKTTTSAWDKLSGVQIGPLVLRRSARQIDFMPTRPELIKNAIQTAPADATAMESIGTPAKGLPALEWLLWVQPITSSTSANIAACTYAVQVAADIKREADELDKEFAALGARKPGEQEENNVPAVSELLNQWTGGLERLRWAEMEKPRLAGATGLAGGAVPSGIRSSAAYARSASGQTAERWSSQWLALRSLGAAQTADAPRPGAGLVPLETYMRGLGRDEPASKLAQTMARTDKALQKLKPANKAGVTAAARTIAEVKKVAEAEVAPAMEVSIGFSDADGD